MFLTGNTVVDAVQWVARSLPDEPIVDEVLVTLHRRASFGAPLFEILSAVKDLAASFPEIDWIYPVHRNPKVLFPAQEVLGSSPNVRLCEPLAYDLLIRQLRRSRLVLTDSGGIQEEAPSFGKPVLVARDKTERPEGVELGAARLVGTDRSTIREAISHVLTDRDTYQEMAHATNPYVDGRASQRIADILEDKVVHEFDPERQKP